MRSLTIAACCLTLAAVAEIPQANTTLSDQENVAVTAYNNGLALVRDTRSLTLPAGELDLRFQDVAGKIRPETVSLRSLRAPGSVTD